MESRRDNFLIVQRQGIRCTDGDINNTEIKLQEVGEHELNAQASRDRLVRC